MVRAGRIGAYLARLRGAYPRLARQLRLWSSAIAAAAWPPPSAVSPNGVAVSRTALNFDVPVMVVSALACLPVFFTGFRISRWEGALFLGYYLVYMVFVSWRRVSTKPSAP